MPELPEVETVVRTLEAQIKDFTILDVHVYYPRIIEGNPDEFRKRILHESFRRFERRGKYLIFRMDHVTLVVHLRMEGKFYIMDSEEPLTKHMHVVFSFDNGKELRYNDTRKFGRMMLLERDANFSHFRDLGPEPFDPTFNVDYVHRYIKGKNVPLKTLLLDQHFVAGIGNIYADEILAVCNLRPGRNCKRITRRDEEHLVANTVRILNDAIRMGGTTIRTYTSSLGVTGLFQTNCSVHMKKICPRCKHAIHMKYIGGRSSYYCPMCQK